jgi:hypothetical protein
VEKEIQETQKKRVDPSGGETDSVEQAKGSTPNVEPHVESSPSLIPPQIIKQGAETAKEDITALNDDEIKYLIILDLIQQNKNGLRITGFQVKDFLELVFLATDIDNVFSKLKSKQFVSDRKDSEEFWLPYKGTEEGRKHKELLIPLLERVAKVAVEALSRNELLERLLYLSYLNKWRIQSYYFPKVTESLAETDRILAAFFFSDDFQKLPEIEKTVRYLRKRQPSLVKEKLDELCQDIYFLKALAMLEMPQIAQKFGVEVVASIYYRDYVGNLSLFLQDKTTERVVRDLLLLGITDSDNLFGVDIQSVLAKEENTSRIKEWLTFNKDNFRRTLRDDWDMFLEAKKCFESSTPSNILEFAESGAMLISKDKLLVRKELKEIYEEVRQSLESVLNEHVKDYKNVIIMPFYQREPLNNLTGQIVITLEVEDWLITENELANNVLLKISPLEVGFKRAKTDRQKNREFNALVILDNLEELKLLFSKCGWVSEDENHAVKKARQIIEDRKTPVISLEEAIDGLREQDFKLVDMLYVVGQKRTGITAIGRGYYSRNEMWADVNSNIVSMYALAEIQVNELQKKLELTIEKKARIDLLTGFSSRESGIVYERCKNQFKERLLDKLNTLDEKSRKALYVFLLLSSQSKELWQLSSELAQEPWIAKFRATYELLFNESFGSSLSELLVKAGFATRGTWVSASGKDNGSTYGIVDFLREVESEAKKRLETMVKVEKPDMDAFRQKCQKNVPLLIGFDYILSSGGYCRRDDLRDFLWKTSLDAWNRFVSDKGIVSPKENEAIFVNPFLISEIRELISTRKKELLKEKGVIKDLVISLENIDHKFDSNEQFGVYQGYIITPAREKIKILVTPWYLPCYEALLKGRSILVVTNQPDYKMLKDSFQEREEVILVFIEGEEFSIYTALSDDAVADSLVSMLHNIFRLKIRETKINNTPEEPGLLQPKMAKDEEKVIENKTGTEEASGASGSLGSTEEVELFEELFKNPKVNFTIGMFAGQQPVILLLSEPNDDDHSSSLQLICKEIYHERAGGLPSPKIRGKGEAYIDEDLIAAKRIEFIENPFESIEPTKWDKIGNRLKEMYSQGFGFVIFHVPPSCKDELKKELEVLTQDLKPPIIELIPITQSDMSLKLMLAGKPSLSDSDWSTARRTMAVSAWGFAIPKSDIDWQIGKTFDQLFAASYREFCQRMSRLLMSNIRKDQETVPAYMVTRRSPSEHDFHYAVKIFVTKYLVEKKNYPLEAIRTEEKEELGIPDIKIVGQLVGLKKDIAIEVETLYGTGSVPLKKISDTIQKYQGQNYEVWVILKNLDVLFFYGKLKTLQASAKKLWGVEVKFLTLDLANQELVKIEKMSEAFQRPSG